MAYIPPGSAVTTLLTLDYCGNKVYRNGVLERTENDYGYLTDSTYYYYIRDYQGNVRAVIDQNGALKEINNYYPYGGLMGAASAGVQPNKYGGKELDRQNGIDWYDFEARYQDPMLPIFTIQDPLAEKTPDISPYAYCAGNPIYYIDPNGCWVEDANGNLVAELDDNAWTLAEFLNTSVEISIKMLNNQGYSVNERGILNLKVGDVFKVEQTSPTPESRDNLAGLGNTIREFAGSEFSKNLFENYWNGGGDIELTDERFAGILLYVKKNKTQNSEGSPVIIEFSNGDKGIGSQKVFDFYSSSEYNRAFGKATLI